jgi:hypothetical protein
MLQSSLVFVTVGVAAIVCGGCVAKSDYLQKRAETDCLNRNLAAITIEKTAVREQIDRLNIERDTLMVDRDRLITERDKLTA